MKKRLNKICVGNRVKIDSIIRTENIGGKIRRTRKRAIGTVVSVSTPAYFIHFAGWGSMWFHRDAIKQVIRK